MDNNNKKIIISLPLVLATILTIATSTTTPQVVYVQGQDGGGISDACLINPSVCGLEGTIERQEESSQLMEEAMREVQEEQATLEEDEEDEEAVQEEDEEIEGTVEEEGVRLYENGTGVISYGALRVTFNWTQTSGDPIVFEGDDITFQNGTVLLS
jgi:membrane protein involved in colicin uptake